MSSQAPNASRATVRKITIGYAVAGLAAFAGFFAPVGTERLAFSMVLMGGIFILMSTGMVLREIGGQPPFSVVPGTPDRAARIVAMIVVIAFLAASHLGLEYRPEAA